MNLKNFQNTKIALLKLITTNKFESNKLPSEAELAKKMRVSIVTLRQALTILATEGYITKRQGLGNFVHQSALDQHMRTDLTYCVENLLKISGYQVGVELVELKTVEPSADTIENLNIGPEDEIVELSLLYTANQQPAALERHQIPTKFFKQTTKGLKRIGKLDDFFWEYCEIELAHEMTTWVPLLADAYLSKQLKLDAGIPLLSWEQLIYDKKDSPVSHSYTYFNPDVIKPRSLRKWNFGPSLDD